MKNLSFNYGSNNGSIITPVPFYIELIQNGVVISNCFSTEGNVSNGLFIKTIQFDDTIATTVKYYNIGRNTNTINCLLKNGNDFNQSGDVFPAANDGMSKAVVLNANNYPSYYLSIICGGTSTTLSGVSYVVAGGTITSAKTGDSAFVSSVTPNVLFNPNYLATTGAPTVSKTTVYNTESLVIGGMVQGDVVTILLDGVASELSPTGYLATDTANANGEITMSNYGTIIGYTFKARYKRNGIYSPYSASVSILQDVVQLPKLIVTAVQLNNSTLNADYYINEEINLTGFTDGALLVVKIDDGTGSLPNSNPPLAVENTDYSKIAITGGYKIKFLRVNVSSQLLVFQFAQSKTGNSNSSAQYVTVRPTRATTATPSVTVSGKSIIVNAVSQQFNIDLWAKIGTATDFTQLGSTVAGVSTSSIYTFSNLVEGIYKVRTQEKDKLYSAFTAEQLIFLLPVIVGSTNQTLGSIISISNLLGGDSLEVAFSANGTNYTSTTINPVVIPTQTGINSYYFYTPTVIGYYKFKRTKGLNVSDYSAVLTIANVVTVAPTISGTSMQTGGTVTISNILSGDTLAYVKDGTTSVTIGVISDTTYSFTTLVEGTYQFRLSRNNILSDLSALLSVISGSQCILSNLEFKQNITNTSIYEVLMSNPQNVSINYILKNSSDEVIVNQPLITSPSTVLNKVKAQIDFSNIIEGINYQILFVSSTTGKTCSILSDRFDFNIINDDPVDVVLTGDDTLDCKGMFLSQFSESFRTDGLEISFRANFNTVITNNPPFFVSIMKQDGTELFQTSTEVLTNYTTGKLRCVIPFSRVPDKFTLLSIKCTVSSSTNTLSDVYSCIASSDYTVTSDTQIITKSVAPILDAITLNSTKLSFTSTCSGTMGRFYVNNQLYTDNSVASEGFVVSTPITTPLKIGDVITAKQICPNKLESDSSGSITVLSVCTKVSGGGIDGDVIAVQNAVKTYKVNGILGSSPFEYETQVSGGEILTGSNTSEITVKITSNTSCVIGFKVKNCNNTQSINLTKSVAVSQIEVGVLAPPRILGLSSNRLTGIADKSVVLTIYNENNEIIANNIPSDKNGVWVVNNIKKQAAYYAIAFYQNTKSTISNIFVLEKVNTITQDTTRKQCNRNVII